MFNHQDEQNPDLSKNVIVRWCNRLFPVTMQLHGDRFTVRENGKLMVTPLLIALITIETSDVAFAVDSIPAVFSVSRDPFILLTSNIFAILGLRALYFALAAIAKYFQYLKYGLGIILIFVGIKMLLAMNEYVNALLAWLGIPVTIPHVEISTGLSLSIIFGTLVLSMVLSTLATKKYNINIKDKN